MPRTLAQNAQYIAETIKPAIKSAIEAQGVTVPSTDSFLDYADRIGEIEGGGSGYQLKDLPTGSISTVNDAAPLPLNALKVSVEAWQDLHGYDHPWVGGAGKNKLKVLAGTASDQGVTVVIHDDGSVDVNGTIEVPNYGFSLVDSLNLKAGSYKLNGSNNGGSLLVLYDTNDQYIALSQNGEDGSFTLADDTNVRLRVFCYINHGLYDETLYPMIRLATETDPTFEPYSNICPIEGWDSGEITVCDDLENPTQTETYTQQFPTTIYGAEWDVVGGELSQTDGYIASYNGESLPSTWISDRDVYASGTTPTIGAEVVYKLATPTTIDLSPLSIRMLQGTNNLYADCGEVIEGEYFSGSAKGYVDGIKYAGEGDGGIASYTNVKSADELLGASAITFEVYARIDSYVSKTSGAYARLMEFGNSQQTGRLGFIGLASDNDNNICYWDDTADIASGIDTWTLGDTHLVSIVKTTAGALKIYIDGVLKYTGSSTLTITSSIIDFVAQRGIYAQPTNTGRQLNGEVFAWRVYAKELSAANIAQNLTADRSLYSR